MCRRAIRKSYKQPPSPVQLSETGFPPPADIRHWLAFRPKLCQRDPRKLCWQVLRSPTQDRSFSNANPRVGRARLFLLLSKLPPTGLARRRTLDETEAPLPSRTQPLLHP